jgi:hypothetical protein
VFEGQNEKCEEDFNTDDIDLNSHRDVFYAVFRQVCVKLAILKHRQKLLFFFNFINLFKVVDTPKEICFLNTLQHLLRIDTKEAKSEVIWNTIETLVHKTTLIESQEDADRILFTFVNQKCYNCQKTEVSSPRKLSFPHTSISLPICQEHHNTSLSSHSPILIHNEKSVNVSSTAPPPPPPPPLLVQKNTDQNISQNIPIPPIFPPPNKEKSLMTERKDTSKSPEVLLAKSMKILPQQEIPTPRAKMKTINWNKIPPNKVIGNKNIWSVVANNHQNDSTIKLNWDEMEGLFCQQITQSSPKLGKETNKTDVLENRRLRRDEVFIHFLNAIMSL